MLGFRCKKEGQGMEGVANGMIRFTNIKNETPLPDKKGERGHSEKRIYGLNHPYCEVQRVKATEGPSLVMDMRMGQQEGLLVCCPTKLSMLVAKGRLYYGQTTKKTPNTPNQQQKHTKTTLPCYSKPTMNPRSACLLL